MISRRLRISLVRITETFYESEGMLKIEHTLYKHPQSGRIYSEFILTKMQWEELIIQYM